MAGSLHLGGWECVGRSTKRQCDTSATKISGPSVLGRFEPASVIVSCDRYLGNQPWSHRSWPLSPIGPARARSSSRGPALVVSLEIAGSPSSPVFRRTIPCGRCLNGAGQLSWTRCRLARNTPSSRGTVIPPRNRHERSTIPSSRPIAALVATDRRPPTTKGSPAAVFWKGLAVWPRWVAWP